MSRQIIEDGLDYLAELKGVRISSVELNELTDKIYDSLDYIEKIDNALKNQENPLSKSSKNSTTKAERMML